MSSKLHHSVVAPPGELRVNAGVVWLAGNTVWSTPKRITTMRCTNRRLPLPLPSILPILNFLGLSVLELVEARDRQMDGRTDTAHQLSKCHCYATAWVTGRTRWTHNQLLLLLSVYLSVAGHVKQAAVHVCRVRWCNDTKYCCVYCI